MPLPTLVAVGAWLRLTDAQRARLIAGYESGASLAELAAPFGRNPSVIRRVLLKAGVQLRPTGRRPLAIGEEAKIAREYVAGLTTIELGERYGVSRDTITRILRAQSVKLRPRGPRH